MASPVVAQVGDAVLTQADLNRMVPPPADSAAYAIWKKQAVEAWVNQQLLYLTAAQHLPPHRQDSLSRILDEIKADLWGHEYLRLRALQTPDTAVSSADIEQYYRQHQALFPSPDTLIGLRFASFHTADLPARLRKRLAGWLRDETSGSDSLLKYCALYNGDCAAGLRWMNHSRLHSAFPELGPTLWTRLLRRQKTVTRLSTSSRTYWFWVEDVRRPGEPMPLPMAAPTIRKILYQEKLTQQIEKIKGEILERARARPPVPIQINLPE